MVLPEFNDNNKFHNHERAANGDCEHLDVADDLLAEQILENITNTPIGQVLKRIASMPEVRKEKVINVRSQLFKGDYKLSERLDAALDKVLEELLT
jgi:hypothetical protein